MPRAGSSSPNQTTSGPQQPAAATRSAAVRRWDRGIAPRRPVRPCSGRAGCCRDTRSRRCCRPAGAGRPRSGSRASVVAPAGRAWRVRGAPRWARPRARVHVATRTTARRVRGRARSLRVWRGQRVGTRPESFCASRKVGMPLSAEIPAPVRTQTCRARRDRRRGTPDQLGRRGGGVAVHHPLNRIQSPARLRPPCSRPRAAAARTAGCRRAGSTRAPWACRCARAPRT